MPTTTATPAENVVVAVANDDVEFLAAAIRSVYDDVVDYDRHPMAVASYLTDAAQQFAATQAVTGRALRNNPSMVKALHGALISLEEFYIDTLRGGAADPIWYEAA